MHDRSSHHHGRVADLPRESEGLPEARKTELVELQDGDEVELEIVPVKKQIGDATLRMLAYNGSVPGPTLKVPQGATISVPETNHGEVVRLYLTDTANTRVFNVVLPGAQMKLVGADAGRYEREDLVEEVLLAPSERVVVDVLFPGAGEFELQHRTPDRTYRL